MLSPEELDNLSGAETLFASPIPVQHGVSPKQQAGLQRDKVAHHKELYERHGAGRSNLAYGYVDKG